MTHPTNRIQDDVHQRVRLGILAILLVLIVNLVRNMRRMDPDG